MFTVEIIRHGKSRCFTAGDGEKLSSFLIAHGISAPHPCGGRGICKKCAVTVNGKEELSCSYIINSDITVILPDEKTTVAVTAAAQASAGAPENIDGCYIALDIGSTTLAMALCRDGKILSSVTANNPQTVFGADVISRIEYCMKHGTGELQKCLLEALYKMTGELLAGCADAFIGKMFVAANTTMLHLFLGTDCSSMGASPYTPVFLESRTIAGAELGFDNIGHIVTLPGFAAFVGADIFSGLCHIGLPPEGKKTLLVDLGTNSEIALFSRDEIVCTSAAAGPCFEGANISCGMSACPGAISHFTQSGAYTVIGDTEPEGLCATGLIDLIALLLDRGIIDETGCLDDGEYRVSDDVSLTAADVRQFQLAKSAVFSAVTVLLEQTVTSFGDIDRLCVAGGFSAEIDMKNAVKTGLFPAELSDRFIPVYNSSLSGAAKYGAFGAGEIRDTARYLDMGSLPAFSEAFMNNMLFE